MPRAVKGPQKGEKVKNEKSVWKSIIKGDRGPQNIFAQGPQNKLAQGPEDP